MHEESSIQKATLPVILSLLGESEEELVARDIDPKDLVAIYNDYLSRQTELIDIAEFISRTMMKATGVHSIKYRVKEPQHLLKKIIRKKEEYPHRTLTISNYLDLINDLVGVRVLHIYKDAWEEIGHYIQDKWKLKRQPYAYVKQLQGNASVEDFTAFGCKVQEHPSGYKAVHFVVETKPEKQRYFAEIQLRTLFEEGWSEIDHSIRYPDHDNSELLDCMLHLLNQFTSQADGMATHMRRLSHMLNRYKQQDKQGDITQELYAYVDQLPVTEAEKQQLHNCVARVTGPDGKSNQS